MSYKFKLDDIHEHLNLKDSELKHISFPNNLGNMNIIKENISHDIFLVREDINSNKNFNLLSDSYFDSYMHMTITLEDSSLSYDYTRNKKVNHFSNGIVIEYKNQSKKSFMMEENKKTKGIGITIKNSFLEENFFIHLKDKKRIQIEKNIKNNITTLFKSSLASSKTLCLAKEIYNSPFNGVLNNLYLQSRVYEIIHDEFLNIINQDEKNKKESRIILSQDDIEALHKAKALILENKRNFSLLELSKKVALNQTKLKYGFKQIFNTTPGTIMLEARMYEAKRLLETSEYNVTEIAQITGYKYVQNFSNAFIKFFGTSPRELMKKRKYYY